jgi:hypothetical protein
MTKKSTKIFFYKHLVIIILIQSAEIFNFQNLTPKLKIKN